MKYHNGDRWLGLRLSREGGYCVARSSDVEARGATYQRAIDAALRERRQEARDIDHDAREEAMYEY